jgi:hypothetical protein
VGESAVRVEVLTQVAAGGGGVSTAQSTLARNLGAKKVEAKKAAQRGDTAGAWRRMGLRSLRKQRQAVRRVCHALGR